MFQPERLSNTWSIRLQVSPAGDAPALVASLVLVMLAPIATLFAVALLWAWQQVFRMPTTPPPARRAQTLLLLPSGAIVLDGKMTGGLARGSFLMGPIARFAVHLPGQPPLILWGSRRSATSDSWRRLRVWWQFAPRANAAPLAGR